MKIKSSLALVLGISISVFSSHGYEAPPTKQASELVESVWLRSDHHTVQAQVDSDSMLHRYVIQSNYGNFEEFGTEFMKMRVREILATAELEKEFAGTKAVEGAAKETVEGVTTLARGVVRPVKTIANVPKGIGSFVKRGAGAAEGNVKADGNYTGGPVRDWFGTQDQKLALAHRLGVDPYTDNEVLNKALNKIAGSKTVGGLVPRIIIPGDGLIAASEEGQSAGVMKDVYLTPATKLYNENRTQLINLGISSDRAVSFLGNSVHSPSEQAFMVRALSKIGQSSGLGEVLSAAESTRDRTGTMTFRRCLQMHVAYVGKGNKIASWTSFRGYPIAVSAAGKLVCPAYLDTVFWSERAETFAKDITGFKTEKGASGVVVLVRGDVSSMAKSELSSRGIEVVRVE